MQLNFVFLWRHCCLYSLLIKACGRKLLHLGIFFLQFLYKDEDKVNEFALIFLGVSLSFLSF